jgi:hypothetical protein
MKEEMNYFYPENGKIGRLAEAHCPYLRLTYTILKMEIAVSETERARHADTSSMMQSAQCYQPSFPSVNYCVIYNY